MLLWFTILVKKKKRKVSVAILEVFVFKQLRPHESNQFGEKKKNLVILIHLKPQNGYL